MNPESRDAPNAIPKVIHQLYFPDASAAPVSYMQYRRSVLGHHSDWEHVFWTEVDARKMLQESYPEYLSMYDSFRYRIQRCDAFRYFLLHKYGGFYVDMDIEFIQPLDSLLDGYELVLSPRTGNAIIGSSSGHPLWPKVFEGMRSAPPIRPSALLGWGYEYYVGRATGRHLLEACVRGGGYDQDASVRIFPGHILEAELQVHVSANREPMDGFEDVHAIHHVGMRGTPRRVRFARRCTCIVAGAAKRLRNRLSPRGSECGR